MYNVDKGRFRGNFVVIFDNLLALLYRITLETLTMTPTCENVETSEGVPLTVTGVAQCKVSILYSMCHWCSSVEGRYIVLYVSLESLRVRLAYCTPGVKFVSCELVTFNC